MKKQTIQDICATAISDAEKSQYCANCKNSYMRPDGFTGYCRHGDDSGDYSHPKAIEAFDWCEHWKSKKD